MSNNYNSALLPNTSITLNSIDTFSDSTLSNVVSYNDELIISNVLIKYLTIKNILDILEKIKLYNDTEVKYYEILKYLIIKCNKKLPKEYVIELLENAPYLKNQIIKIYLEDLDKDEFANLKLLLCIR